MKRFITAAMTLLATTLMAQDMTFNLPEVAGTLRMGFAQGEESFWFADAKVKKSGTADKQVFVVSDKRMGKGSVTIEVNAMKDTKGYTLKVQGENLPDGAQLVWAYGGSSGEATMPENNFTPEQCKDNVFSVEGCAFSVYYGTSRRLRIVSVLTPVGSDIRLSDARKMTTPMQMFSSGKKTDAPALCAVVSVENGKALYFAAYKQNPKADYNEFMLEELHKNGSYVVHKDVKWMESTPN